MKRISRRHENWKCIMFENHLGVNVTACVKSVEAYNSCHKVSLSMMPTTRQSKVSKTAKSKLLQAKMYGGERFLMWELAAIDAWTWTDIGCSLQRRTRRIIITSKAMLVSATHTASTANSATSKIVSLLCPCSRLCLTSCPDSPDTLWKLDTEVCSVAFKICYGYQNT